MNSSAGGIVRVLALLLFLGIALLASCALPSMPQRPDSRALDADAAAQTALGRALAPRLQRHPDRSGLHLLGDPLEAFAARMLLAHAAQRSLDVQYYIWRGDQTGTLLLHALLNAADRGVRVRLLLDDGGTSGLDRELATLAQHPHIEVRLFNPFALRWPKPLGYLTDFARTNRRMHSKSFTADNRVSIVGGRNVGDEYFGASDGVVFADLDVLAVGSVVEEVSTEFDRYWASLSAWPAQAILPAPDPAALQELSARASALTHSDSAQAYVRAVRDTAFIQDLLAQRLSLHWSRVEMVSDDPAKALGQAEPKGLLIDQLHRAVGTPQRSIMLVSPYFVPTSAGTDALLRLRERDITVRVMTNAYEATDVPLVHAGYAKHRKALLRGGVDLYEMRRSALSPGAERGPRPNRLGSSGSSLHAKTYAVDGERVFVGSYNFDPRSALLNTELGFVIHSPEFAQLVERVFDTEVPRRSYTLRLSGRDEIEWLDTAHEPPLAHRVEPNSTWWSRAMLRLLAWLPIDWLL
ncbi:MAG: phospholipase D family protein [Burkholderiales bacterium]|nr:phospholipase D family protein [Burkholderiales bacterium]